MAAAVRSTWRNPLAYPAGIVPGFDPTHPAARNAIFSGIADGGNFVNLLTGAVGTKNGSPTANIKGVTGPGVLYQTGANSSTFSGCGTGSIATITMAAIVVPPTATGSQAMIYLSNGAAGDCDFYISGSNALTCYLGGTQPSGPTLVAGVPYFVAMSCVATVGNMTFIAKRLDTGNVTISNPTAPTSGLSTNGAVIVGNDGFGQAFNGTVAAAMASKTLLSTWQLAQWAADPWSYWYPDAGDDWVAAAAASGFSPWWAANNNLPVLGTGTY